MGNADSSGQQWASQHVPDLSGQVFVVTGCSSGIGAEAARVFAAKGAYVIMANRSEQKTRDLLAAWARESPHIPQDSFEFVPCDLADLDSIAACAATILKTHPRIDVLVCNAGVMALPLTRTKQGHEMQFGTNMLGHYALITQLLPALKADPSKPGRITIVSSGAHLLARKVKVANLDCSKGYSAWGRYIESKLGDLLIMTHLKRKFAEDGSNITVTACHPGYSSTNLQTGTSFQRTNGCFAQSSFMGSLPTVMAATDTTLKSGAYIGPSRFSAGLPSAGSKITRSARNQEHAAEVCEFMEHLMQQ